MLDDDIPWSVDFDSGRAEARDDVAGKPWPAAEPLDGGAVPTFPAEALPPVLRDWSIATAEAIQVPVDLPAVLALGVCSFGASRIVSVQAMPSWREPVNLYLAVAMSPGERKSAVFRRARKPMDDYLHATVEQVGLQVAQYESAMRILKERLADAEKAKSKGKPVMGASIPDIIADIDSIKRPSMPLGVADDITPEALAVLLSESTERVGVFSAEGGPFEMMAGRYTDRGTNFEIFLKSHPGDSHTVKRIKREPLSLRNPLITMALTVQPEVIAGLAKKEGFRHTGLLARVLYSMPPSMLGNRRVDVCSVPEYVDGAYHEAIGRLFRRSGSVVLSLSDDADRACRALQRRIEPRLGPDGDLSFMADWASKLAGSVVRLAGTMHAAECTSPNMTPTISGDTWARAQQIGEYFLSHARAAIQTMESSDESRIVARLWSWIARRGVVEFSRHEAAQFLRTTPELLASALSALSARNLIRLMPAAPARAGRPASERYEVHPSYARTV